MLTKMNVILNPFKNMTLHKTKFVARQSVCASVQGIFRQRDSIPLTPMPSVPPAATPSAVTGTQVNALRNIHLQAGIRALHGAGGQKLSRRFEAMFEQESLDDTQHDAADKTTISAALALKKDLIDTLAACLKQRTGQSGGVAKQEARHIFEEHLKEELNSAPWHRIDSTFTFAENQFNSNHIPAGQMKLGQQDIFGASYQNTGICSKSSRETTHAVNLWSSELTVQEGDKTRTLFTGLRHGVLSPYGVKDAQERRHGALNRAKEIVTAALWLQPEKLARGLSGETIRLQLTSTGLLTPVDISASTEKSQLMDQIAAWKALSDAKPVVLNIRDEKGEIRPVRVEVDIAAFNFGVNELALGLLKLGHGVSDDINAAALEKLLGKDLAPGSPAGGWVGDYLAGNPANREQVERLARQIKEIIAGKTHHADGGEPYKAAMRIVLLTSEIGLVPCWNCKSGKDRTGMLDVELKRHMASAYLGATPTKIGMLDQQGRQLQQQLLLHSGNLEVQRHNTGAPGNKTLRNNKLANALIGGLSLRDRVGDEAIAKISKGLSDYV